ncbi:hypothetical protein NQ314_017041 [Rhamnusium bicolor]|uniref:Transposase Helix-turn-helix domain-containing protein n=1 Tax=Rhamnusium bicolor TaxID=1586634 RepID=A0AAV8WVI4_9CUCU|nr:hypothetical protein NQ314_017041 [Rhamnusium bicolor]
MPESELNTSNVHLQENRYQPMDVEELQEVSVESLQLALQNANKEIYSLREEISKFKLNEKYLKSNEKSVLYYTGFPEYIYVHNIFQIVEPYLLDHSALSKFQQLLMTLIKLRLDLQFTDLANRFLCHRTTAARIFENTIHVLYCRLKKFSVLARKRRSTT